ncbi:MAG: hypothetical protein Fur009_6400 [Candidatus Microgenomates bacterium]
MSRQEKSINPQLSHQERYKRYLKSIFKPSLENFFSNLKNKDSFLPDVKEKDYERIMEIVYRNNLMAHILESREFAQILKEEKELKGDAKVGVVMCIDGRISILHQFGRTVNTKEVPGSLLNTSSNNNLEDTRFIQTLEQLANEDRELLQIITAHTSLKHQDHKCGAITKAVNKGVFTGGIDQVAYEQAKKRASAIEEKYNEILRNKGKKPQEIVAIAAMINTDDMGLFLNFSEQNQLSTTDIVRQHLHDIKSNTNIEFGAMKDNFSNPLYFLNYFRNILEITKYLLNKNIFDQYINDNFSELSDSQKQSLKFILSRTAANQYLTGLASDEEFHHSFAEHDEDYLVVSPHGKPFGRFDLRQSFGSVPSSRGDALEYIKIKLGIMDSNQDKEPRILFLSTPINPQIINISPDYLRGLENAAIVYFQQLMKDKELKEKIKNGELVVVPMLVDENNGRVLEIRDYSVYLN